MSDRPNEGEYVLLLARDATLVRDEALAWDEDVGERPRVDCRAPLDPGQSEGTCVADEHEYMSG